VGSCHITWPGRSLSQHVLMSHSFGLMQGWRPGREGGGRSQERRLIKRQGPGPVRISFDVIPFWKIYLAVVSVAPSGARPA
jgi:hypothetical protein